MEHRNQLQLFAANPVRDEARGVRDDKLARSDDSARPADLRVGLKQSDGPDYPASDQSCVVFRVSLDMLSQLGEVAYRSPRPNDRHLGALVSPGFPQDSSHFETFS